MPLGRRYSAPWVKVKAERRAILRLRDEGLISDDVLRTVEREMDLEATRYQATEMSL